MWLEPSHFTDYGHTFSGMANILLLFGQCQKSTDYIFALEKRRITYVIHTNGSNRFPRFTQLFGCICPYELMLFHVSFPFHFCSNTYFPVNFWLACALYDAQHMYNRIDDWKWAKVLSGLILRCSSQYIYIRGFWIYFNHFVNRISTVYPNLQSIVMGAGSMISSLYITAPIPSHPN